MGQRSAWHLLDNSPPEEDYIPERRLLLSILGRAIYDLRPEANHVARRDSIAWFRETGKQRFKRITSFYYIKSELNLGVRILGRIEIALQDALLFEKYYWECHRNKERPNIQGWLSSRENIINTSRRSCTPHVRYPKISRLDSL